MNTEIVAVEHGMWLLPLLGATIINTSYEGSAKRLPYNYSNETGGFKCCKHRQQPQTMRNWL